MSPLETFPLTSPEQLKAISDPFRQRLIGAFVRPRTAKAAAAMLSVPVGRLYHHLDQLVCAGLLSVVSERRRRGAIERTFQAVAQRFAIGLGGAAAAGRAEVRASMARVALNEILAAASDPGAPELHIVRARPRLTPDALAELESRFGELCASLSGPDGVETDLLLFASQASER